MTQQRIHHHHLHNIIHDNILDVTPIYLIILQWNILSIYHMMRLPSTTVWIIVYRVDINFLEQNTGKISNLLFVLIRKYSLFFIFSALVVSAAVTYRMQKNIQSVQIQIVIQTAQGMLIRNVVDIGGCLFMQQGWIITTNWTIIEIIKMYLKHIQQYFCENVFICRILFIVL